MSIKRDNICKEVRVNLAQYKHPVPVNCNFYYFPRGLLSPNAMILRIALVFGAWKGVAGWSEP